MKDGVTFIESQLKFDENKCKRVLGVKWGTKTDQFVFRFSDLISLAKSLRTTKRNGLKLSASFYDPLGIISLVTLQVKTTFHLLWQDKLDWDDKVPQEIEIICIEFNKKFRNTRYFSSKRFAFYEIKDKICSLLLNEFCDTVEPP